MKLELTKAEQEFLIRILLKEIENVQKVKTAYNVFGEDDPKAKMFYKSFWELDTFVHELTDFSFLLIAIF